MSLTSAISVNANSTLTSPLDQGTASFPANVKNLITLTNGAGANQANQLFSDQRSLNATTSEELDLAGTLTNAFGATITFTKIKGIIISADASNGGDIEVGGSASNGFDDWVGATGDYIKVKPGGVFALVAPDATGYAVTASTGDLLKINNTDAASGTYDITIIGVE